MLTASISGSIHTSPPSHSILNLIKEIGTNHDPGIKNSNKINTELQRFSELKNALLF